MTTRPIRKVPLSTESEFRVVETRINTGVCRMQGERLVSYNCWSVLAADDEVEPKDENIDPTTWQPAILGISHLHEVSTIVSNDREPIHNFLGFGTSLQVRTVDGVQHALKGDTFIRFVPRLQQSFTDFVNVTFPDPAKIADIFKQAFTKVPMPPLLEIGKEEPSQNVSPSALQNEPPPNDDSIMQGVSIEPTHHEPVFTFPPIPPAKLHPGQSLQFSDLNDNKHVVTNTYMTPVSMQGSTTSPHDILRDSPPSFSSTVTMCTDHLHPRRTV